MKGGICDFCSDPHPTWVYPARDFVMNKYSWGSESDWAACEECSQLIEDDKHDTVVTERMLPRGISSYGPLWEILSKDERRQVEHEVRRLYNKFRQSRKGGRKLLANA